MAINARFVLTDRRDLLCGGGASVFAAMAGSLLAGATPVRADQVSGRVPEVERLVVTTVVDSYQIAVAPDFKTGNVGIKRFGFALSEQPPGRSISSEFGLSLHVASKLDEQTRNVLIDFAFTPEALNNNLSLLNLDASRIDALVLSHGHYDHFGGLTGFLRQNKGKLQAKLPIYLGGEECFCARQWNAPPMKGDFGALDRDALKDADLAVMFSPGPALVAEHGFTTGQVSLASFEKVLSPSTMRIGRVGNFGCYAAEFTEDEQTKGLIPDQFRHEIATAYHLKGRGLVVFSSCSHRGIVNVVQQAKSVSGVDKVHAIIGGFHLVSYKEDYVREVVAALKEIGPDYVIPMHCSGEPFYEIMKAEMPETLLRSYTGTQFTFDA
jgi:7,8-dihydropterin-6-yl-methyl-4-(beta-D-ribofuranosyl)aminobenzene 5'-phosphate synthase